MKNTLRITLFVLALLAAGVLFSGVNYHKVDQENIEKEIARTKEAKQQFEAELAIVVPAEAKTEIAPYGSDFYHTHTEGIVNGYILTRVYRLHNYTKENAALLFRSHLEQIGYKDDLRRRGMSNEEGFNVSTLVIPFEDNGFVDVKVELWRLEPFDLNRKYYDEIREYEF